MSPTLVREGPARLSTDGSVKQTGKKEANIAEITKDDIQQICEVRKILEPYTASLIVKKFSSDNNVEDRMGKAEQASEEIQEMFAAAIALTIPQYKGYLGIDLRLQELVLKT